MRCLKMATKFRLNRYNWFCQKLLVQHRHDEIIELKRDLEMRYGHPVSEHMKYANGIAQMRTSASLDEVLVSLQSLNFDKNNKYLLLLCQCLLYLGNYDSVVALCKQVISKEIKLLEYECQLEETRDELSVTCDEPGSTHFNLDSINQESNGYQRVLQEIRGNLLINEPKLWLIFGLCLEYQRLLKDAHSAYKVASNLSLAPGLEPKLGVDGRGNSNKLVDLKNYHTPHSIYADFVIRNRGDLKSALHTLIQAYPLYPQNYSLNPFLALLLSVQPSSNRANFAKATEIMSSLEFHSVSKMNPSSHYNQLALLCNRKPHDSAPMGKNENLSAGLEARADLSYLLVKGYIMLNRIDQESNDERSSLRQNSNFNQSCEHNSSLPNQIDKVIELMRNSDPSCWESASLWNNLGLCHLLKRKFIASLSCLSKAYDIDPLDWRVNYNISVACCHVGLFARSFVHLTAAKKLYSTRASMTSDVQARELCFHPSIVHLLAVCYQKLGHIDEARRSFISLTQVDDRDLSCAPIPSIVNYLIFLHSNRDPDDEQKSKIELHLLDQLEHCWLQRNKNDSQFSAHLLELANSISDDLYRGAAHSTLIKKQYAWNKSDV